MDLTLDRKKRKVTGDAVSLSESVVASLKLSHEEFVRVKLLDDGADAELATGEAIVLVLKPEGQFEGDAIQIATLTPSDLKLGRYEKLFSTQTDAGRALLGIDGNSANDVSSKRIIGALVYVPAMGEPREADEFYINFRNAVYQAGDTEVDVVDGPGALLTARAVRHDIEQTISTEGKGRARANINAAEATHSHSDLAPKESPALTGTPTTPTAAPGTSTTQIANTEFVATTVANLVASSPAALDTLNELATALANDPDFATTMTNALAGKVPTSRNVATSGLASGGGALSADRTIDVPIASQAEAEAGTDNSKAMTPERVKQAIAALAGGGTIGIDTQVFDQPGNWTWGKPANAKKVSVLVIAGGGGAGAGRRGATETGRSGGGGGGGGCFVLARELDASQFAATENLVVGAGGVGAAGQTLDDTHGGNGTAGGDSSFSEGATQIVAKGGLAGTGGTTGSGAAGASQASSCLVYPYVSTSSAASAPGAAGSSGSGATPTVNATSFPTGGGGGGGISTGGVGGNGGAGGANATAYANFGALFTQTGAAGGNGGGADGTTPATAGADGGRGLGFCGRGGGGGGAPRDPSAGGFSDTGKDGGNGSLYGGGGGGGGASQNGFVSGKGGDGAHGVIVVVTEYSDFTPSV